MTPRAELKYPFRLGPPSISRSAEKPLCDEVMLRGMATPLNGRERVGILRPVEATSTNAAILGHVQ